jgi:hypothetical protein
MSEPQFYATIWDEDGSKYVLARVKRKNSTHDMSVPATSDVSSITRVVYSIPSSTVILASTTLTTSDVFLSAMSTGNIWDTSLGGTTGFNFIDNIPVGAFATGNANVLVEYKITLTAGDVFPLRVRGPVLPLEGS